eukprot:scaffold70184_cov35-Tisochrysis_lutea.AAC.3
MEWCIVPACNERPRRGSGYALAACGITQVQYQARRAPPGIHPHLVVDERASPARAIPPAERVCLQALLSLLANSSSTDHRLRHVAIASAGSQPPPQRGTPRCLISVHGQQSVIGNAHELHLEAFQELLHHRARAAQ